MAFMAVPLFRAPEEGFLLSPSFAGERCLFAPSEDVPRVRNGHYVRGVALGDLWDLWDL